MTAASARRVPKARGDTHIFGRPPGIARESPCRGAMNTYLELFRELPRPVRRWTTTSAVIFTVLSLLALVLPDMDSRDAVIILLSGIVAPSGLLYLMTEHDRRFRQLCALTLRLAFGGAIAICAYIAAIELIG